MSKPKTRSPAKRANTDRFLRLLAEVGDTSYLGQPNDIIIPVMGPTGSGKTTFINSLLSEGQDPLEVGHMLHSCTSTLHPVEISINTDKYHFELDPKDGPVRIIIVDTPGFDDTMIDDAEILRRISVWLASSYNQDTKLGGVIYLHGINNPRMSGTARRNLDMFRKLIGHNALKAVTLGTTHWGTVDHGVAEARHDELQKTFWAGMHEAGSKIYRIQDTQESPREMVEEMLQYIEAALLTNPFLRIQEEIALQQKFIPETDAGKTLKYSLEELIEIQQKRVEKLAEYARAGKSSDDDKSELKKEFREGQERLRMLLRATKDMKVPFSERIKRFFT